MSDDEKNILFQITGLDRLQLVECKKPTTKQDDDSSSSEEGSYANDSAVVAKKRLSASTLRSSTVGGTRRSSSILTLGTSQYQGASSRMGDSIASDLSSWFEGDASYQFLGGESQFLGGSNQGAQSRKLTMQSDSKLISSDRSFSRDASLSSQESDLPPPKKQQAKAA